MIRKLIFDVDNVLADSIGAWCKLARRDAGIDVDFACIRNHKLVGCVGLPAEKVFKLQDLVWMHWKELSPVETNIQGIVSKIRKMGVQIAIATSGPRRHVSYVREWLTYRRISCDKFYWATNKSDIDADALVDDAPEEIERFASTERIAFMYDRPWNQLVLGSSFTRISSIARLHDILKRDRSGGSLDSKEDCD
jgi:5'(3')-deoxyribonucleotidase